MVQSAQSFVTQSRRIHSSAEALAPPADASAQADSHRSSQSQPFLDLRPFAQKSTTRLPTPLPGYLNDRYSAALKLRAKGTAGGDPELDRGTLKALREHNQYFMPSSKLENLGVLQACIASGLIERAAKLFEDMRITDDVKLEGDDRRGPAQRSSTLDIGLYNTMLSSYLDKACKVDSREEQSRWASTALALFSDMHTGSRGAPAPNAATYAATLHGFALLTRGGPQARRPDVVEVLRSARSSRIPLSDIFSPAMFAHVALNWNSTDILTPSDAINVLVSIASSHGEESIVEELLQLRDQLDGDERGQRLAEHASRRDTNLEELEPTRSTLKDAEGNENDILFNLRLLKENLSAVSEARARHSSALARQRWLEESAFESARKRLEHAAQQLEELGLSHTSKLKHRTLQTWMWSWYQELSKVLEADLTRIEKSLNKPAKRARKKSEGETAVMEEEIAARVPEREFVSPNRISIPNLETSMLPFLRTLPVKKLALIPILEIMRMQSGTPVFDGMKTTRVLLAIGRAIEQEYFGERRQKYNRLRQRHGAEDHQPISEDALAETQWSQQTRARVGSYLVQHLMQVAKVPRSARDRHGRLWEENQPAFYAAYQYVAGKKLGVIRLNDALLERLDKDSIADSVHPRHLPMLVPPRPWTHHNDGGYLQSRSYAMRFKDSAEQAEYFREADERQELSVLLAGLDALGQTAWRINERIFEAVTKVWNSGEAMADIPPATHPLPEPERPENYDSTDMSVKKEYIWKLKTWNAQRSNFHSQRCDVNYKLEIARAFIGERFYFPHNMDFRGRAYPIPPLFNHIGNDLCRGLLLFDTAKPLGKQGLRWLRIHLANVYGYDKANFLEREQFALEHEKEIRAAANDPLSEEGKWWRDADDPWQCLAACIELVKAYDNPDGPEAFESRLPVHQDGTCNGLQHYAALGGDLQGAQQVNLSGGERPSDVYTGVATLVMKQIDRDAADPTSPNQHLAQLLQGKVTRKVVKQTVMTTVYGVTFIGAKNQIHKQLTDRNDTPLAHRYACATYLAAGVLACIGDLFKGAESIQHWLTQSAKLIARSIPPYRVKSAAIDPKDVATSKRQMKEQMTAVIWSTPLNLPVVQPYRKIDKKQVSTSMQTVFINDPNRAAEVHPAKQASAFPPNFIHSLDATHMFLTALECSTRDLVFASVHDSYWTHACDIDTMSDIIRDTFVRLHSSDILPKLREDFLSRAAEVHPAKQASAFPPNFIHSLDATHMFLTALECSTRDLVFASVHDSYWTHACDIDTMSDIIRDTFVRLHSRDGAADSEVVEKAESDIELEESLPETSSEQSSGFLALADVLPPLPQKGAFDVNEIRRSLYFFS
ncbi:Mitochondrial/chloroplast DNA-directed RNA polymerase RPO41, provides primers for DNA replication-initiation [Ceraceosorus bombacis]|uniref:DNA-directed RNA polymerase n=1 Tax=Ceraceosorus bombacis TaxID=401625 RepID=A0A0P1BBZ4_9BASI|nr:Mitochondrial/chloroplast DNA-directed RNA polymerase RPO41, provides primers for DNA replication-initiation [Ceraceosorus bombacis]